MKLVKVIHQRMLYSNDFIRKVLDDLEIGMKHTDAARKYDINRSYMINVPRI